MPIGKGRDRRRGGRAEVPPRDPADTDAYEHGWYAMLAQHVEERAAESNPEIAAAEDDPELATVTELVVPPAEPSLPEAAIPREHRAPPVVDRAPALRHPPVEAMTPVTTERPTVRIGVRHVSDPEAVYLRYLTESPHRHFFRGGVWPASRAITPVQLWRANHLGAVWELELVERFLRDAVDLANAAVSSAPRSAPAGSPERRVWIERLLTAGWAREFGLARVTKTLFPLVPELVPDLDPSLTEWARASWFRVPELEDGDEVDRALETWELLEDTLVLRGRTLAAIARRLAVLAPGLAPVGPLGLVLAILWDDRWVHPGPTSGRPSRRAPASKTVPPKATATPKAPRGRSSTRGPGEGAAARKPKKPAS